MSLENKRVVLAASRKTEEMSLLIEKQKGTPLVRSLQGTVFLNDEQVREDLKQMVQQKFDWMIFTTGIGTNKLLELAEEMNVKGQLLDVIRQSKVGARGYKTFAALKQIDVKPAAKDEDGTIRGLIESLQSVDFKGKKVLVQLHGENAPTLIDFLEEAGAEVMQVLPYKHVDPDPQTVELFCQELINNEIDAVCFTAAIQVRSFFKYVREKEYLPKVIEALNKDVMAVAVGKVTAEALSDEGVERIVSPELERMGAMIIELSKYYEEHK
ncbi:uroporphyrinogen-III synthase [Halalkalibacter krulwichiae]|uniref:Uroporphyrinogen-III synthase n=1 Tax=Halalkalibacter krulwichiae TaxID=199441 RepID=A0A1Y9TI51_9BACI|nr:uroporphyrinogen-III synthase [Halalkalibacter krulwichiae]ARK28588.1 uroporphyrinogen-III synthase [Halalkalibacter krulwichiae]